MITGESEINPIQAESVALAERELGAFLCAVKESYGSGQAILSEADWLDELESESSGDWRAVTIAAAGRLASRIATQKTGGKPSGQMNRQLRPPVSSAC